MDYGKISLKRHKELKGKIEVAAKAKIKSLEDLAVFYTPGVAEVSRQIAKDRAKSWDYTNRSNSVAVISDGSAVLGLGNIGAEAAQPVMAGKALLMKEFAGIDAYPIVLATQDTEEIIKTVKYLAPNFGAINLEDISAPRCFEIEERLQDLGIPVMHDDQHGTAVVVLAGLINATKLVGKKLENCKIVIVGAGAAGTAIALMLAHYTKDKTDICAVDRQGIVCSIEDKLKRKICKATNCKTISGGLDRAIIGADIFIGVSAPNILKQPHIKKMAKDPIVFAMANPIPEIMPDEAKKAGARIVATGRSDFKNQVNNVLAFPGIFRGALDAKVTKITTEMLVAAAEALARSVKNPMVDKILPSPLERLVVKNISRAVKAQAQKEKVIRI